MGLTAYQKELYDRLGKYVPPAHLARLVTVLDGQEVPTPEQFGQILEYFTDAIDCQCLECDRKPGPCADGNEDDCDCCHED